MARKYTQSQNNKWDKKNAQVVHIASLKVAQPPKGFYRRLVPFDKDVLPCITRETQCCSDAIIFERADGFTKGLTMAETSRSPAEIMEFLNDVGPVFTNIPHKMITVVVSWPGYSHLRHKTKISTRRSGTDRFWTHAELAKELRKIVQEFFWQAQYYTCTKPAWKVAPRESQDEDGLRWQEVVLLGLCHAIDNVWALDLAIDQRD